MSKWFSVIAVGICCLFITSSTCNAATIYACKQKVGGALRIVKATTVCLATEKKISLPDEAQVAALEARIAALETLLEHFSRNGSDISITGANLWIKSGSGVTNGAISGLGNLIVGYNELRGGGLDDRSGSHNIIVGSGNNYTSNGGFIAGTMNTISAPFTSVSGGYGNTANGWYSSVSGGNGNFASNYYASVSGGYQNTASANSSSVSGGQSLTQGSNSGWTGGAYHTP